MRKLSRMMLLAAPLIAVAAFASADCGQIFRVTVKLDDGVKLKRGEKLDLVSGENAREACSDKVELPTSDSVIMSGFYDHDRLPIMRQGDNAIVRAHVVKRNGLRDLRLKAIVAPPSYPDNIPMGITGQPTRLVPLTVTISENSAVQ